MYHSLSGLPAFRVKGNNHAPNFREQGKTEGPSRRTAYPSVRWFIQQQLTCQACACGNSGCWILRSGHGDSTQETWTTRFYRDREGIRYWRDVARQYLSWLRLRRSFAPVFILFRAQSRLEPCLLLSARNLALFTSLREAFWHPPAHSLEPPVAGCHMGRRRATLAHHHHSGPVYRRFLHTRQWSTQRAVAALHPRYRAIRGSPVPLRTLESRL